MNLQAHDDLVSVIAHSVVLDASRSAENGISYPDGQVLYPWKTVTALVRGYCDKRYRYYFVAEWVATARDEDYFALASDIAHYFDRSGVIGEVIEGGIIIRDIYTSC